MSDQSNKYKRIVKNESPEVLAALMESMAEHIESQKKLITKLEAEKAAKDQQNFNIEEKLKLIRRLLYGKKSESRQNLWAFIFNYSLVFIALITHL